MEMINTKCKIVVVTGLVRQGTFMKRGNRKALGTADALLLS